METGVRSDPEDPACAQAARGENDMAGTAETVAEARAAERADVGPWLELAREFEPLFGAPMAKDPVFERVLLRNIARGTAFCIREHDGPPGSRLLGGLLLSPRPPVYRIGWLAVTESERRFGLGRRLLERAQASIPAGAELVVVTFGPDADGGGSARAFYQKMGFTPAEAADPAPNGASRQVFRRSWPSPGNPPRA
jgi:GNAT superfamily N-acetyltransferase